MGLAVFPLAERTKVPAIAGGFKNATTDPEQIRAWWEYRPTSNVGIATGGMSGGLVVLDCDFDEAKGEDGMETVAAHEHEHGKLPEGACCTTPRGGMHLYFRASEPFDCSVNPEEGIDVRADGGYVVAPPSVTDVGSYEWDLDIADYGIPQADASALALLRRLNGKKRGNPFKLPEKIGKGKRNDTLFRLACSMQSYGNDDGVIYSFVSAINKDKCTPPLPDGEVEKLVEQALSYQKGEGRKRPPGNTGAVSTMLRVNDKGMPFQTISNCEVVLNNDVRLAGRFFYDERAYTKTVELPLPWDDGEGTRAIRDSDYASLTAYMEREYMITKKERVADAVLTTCAANRKNRVAEWLASLRWDGEERIGEMLPLFLGAEPTEYNAEVMRLFMRAAVARALHPGCKFDYMMVLAGKQGIGKSTFVRLLAHDPAWYDGNFNVITGVEAVERLRGVWIAEMAELLSTKGKAVEAVKSFLTNQVDSIRPKYGRETEQRPRACVFAGTTNDGSFLSDPTGNRRFLVVECNAQAANPALFDDSAPPFFDACWAEAYARYMHGETRLVLPKRLEGAAEDVRTKYEEEDTRIGIIQDYVDNVIREAAFPSEVRVCVPEILEYALEMHDSEGKNPPRRLVNEIHAVLRDDIDGIVPYGSGTGKLRTSRWGAQRCYVVDMGSAHVAELLRKRR